MPWELVLKDHPGTSSRKCSVFKTGSVLAHESPCRQLKRLERRAQIPGGKEGVEGVSVLGAWSRLPVVLNNPGGPGNHGEDSVDRTVSVWQGAQEGVLLTSGKHVLFFT